MPDGLLGVQMQATEFLAQPQRLCQGAGVNIAPTSGAWVFCPFCRTNVNNFACISLQDHLGRDWVGTMRVANGMHKTGMRQHRVTCFRTEPAHNESLRAAQDTLERPFASPARSATNREDTRNTRGPASGHGKRLLTGVRRLTWPTCAV